ncbi:MAG: hypothetical protein IIV90_06315, partial [Oscillospiraceae bacterium]|nr:hypothetical protein [Oscillospiraceae bacterium]
MTADILALARWWGVFFLLGLAALPYALALFGGLRDKGWAFSKVLGLAFCSWLSFAGATGQSFRLLPFRVWSCWLWLGLFAFCGWVCLLAGPDPQRPHGLKCRLWAWGQKVRAALKDKAFLRRAAAEEIAFFLALALWSYLRATNPELRDLEKFMDHGFVAAILNSTWMPAQDMWYAGEGINYYYYGHFATAYLCRLAGVGSAVGYNLSMATTFALTLSLSAALGYSLMGLFCAGRPAPFGKKREELLCTGGAVFSALLVAVGGNGHAFVHGLVLPFLNRLGLVDYTAEYWYPDATRYINCYEGSTDATIHEFPFYSFIVSDLHAHVLDICFVLLFLALSLVWLGHARQNARAGGSLPAGVVCPAFFLCGFLLGLMAMTNFWDFAIYTIVSLFFAAWAAGLRRSPLQAGFWGELAARMAILVACKTI